MSAFPCYLCECVRVRASVFCAPFRLSHALRLRQEHQFLCPPSRCQTLYQLVDLADSNVKQLLQASKVQSACSVRATHTKQHKRSYAHTNTNAQLYCLVVGVM